MKKFRPLTNDKVTQLLSQVWGNDISMIVLTQELLVYLGLFISTEPQLFQSMIRLRTGLIIQVMIGELQQALNCSVEYATEHLLNLSPFETKILLHMVISGKELGATSIYSSKKDPKGKIEEERQLIKEELKVSFIFHKKIN